jgi:hypothetical protein
MTGALLRITGHHLACDAQLADKVRRQLPFELLR